MTKKDKKAIEEAFVRISAKDPHCSSCIFRTEWEHIGKSLRNILDNNQPSRRKGHWIRITNGAMKEKYICSECGRQIENDGIEGLLPIKYPYCHCGAEMVEMQEREDKGCGK